MDQPVLRKIKAQRFETRAEENGGREVVGIAANGDTYDMHYFTERIAPEAWGDLNRFDVRALINHDTNRLLARSKKGVGTLSLETTPEGLQYRFSLPDTPTGKEAAVLLDRGDISQSSWSFTVEREEWDFTDPDKPHREILEIGEMRDVSLVTYPANPSTNVELRAELEKARELQTLKNKAMEQKKLEERVKALESHLEKKADPKPDPKPDPEKRTAFVDSSVIAQGLSKSEERDINKFNVAELMQQVSNGKLEGLYADLNKEGIKERSQTNGRIGNDFSFHFPEEVRNAAKRTFEQRQNTVTAGTQPQEGGNLVQSTLQDFIKFLYPDTPILNMCKRYEGLRDDKFFPTETVIPSLQWGTEIENTTTQDSEWSRRGWAPQRARILCGYSRRLATQGVGAGIASDLTTQINNAFNTGIEQALINGDGVAPNPSGILTEITPSVVGALDLTKMVQVFELGLKNKDALRGRLAYVTSPNVQGFMKYTPTDAGSGKFLAQPNNENQRLDVQQISATGYPVHATTLMPQFGAGPFTEAMIFGNFEDVALLMWGGAMLEVNPYSRMKESIVEIYAERQMNVAVLRPDSFVTAEDITV